MRIIKKSLEILGVVIIVIGLHASRDLIERLIVIIIGLLIAIGIPKAIKKIGKLIKK